MQEKHSGLLSDVKPLSILIFLKNQNPTFHGR